MDSHSPSASVALSTQSHRCSERPCVLIPWREPSSQEYRRIKENLYMPNPTQQPNFYQPCHQLEYEAQRLLCGVTDSRPGPSYRPSLGSISAIGEAGSRAFIDSAGMQDQTTTINPRPKIKILGELLLRATKLPADKLLEIMGVRSKNGLSHPAWVPAIIRWISNTRARTWSHPTSVSSKSICGRSLGQ